MFELQPATPDATTGGRLGGGKRRRLAGQAKAGGAGRQGGGPQGWLPQAELVVQRFDQQLTKVLAAALDACSSGGTQQGDAVGAQQQRTSGLGETAVGRALILEPFVQDRCACRCRWAHRQLKRWQMCWPPACTCLHLALVCLFFFSAASNHAAAATPSTFP
jgi:hypothetical protein